MSDSELPDVPPRNLADANGAAVDYPAVMPDAPEMVPAVKGDDADMQDADQPAAEELPAAAVVATDAAMLGEVEEEEEAHTVPPAPELPTVTNHAPSPPLLIGPALPSPPSTTPIAPPPPPAVVLPLPPPPPPALRQVPGNLTVALEAAHRDACWLLVALARSGTLPDRLEAPLETSNAIHAWRPLNGGNLAETYTSFFPTTSPTHIALLDPRTGERLVVWGEPPRAGEEAEEPTWSSIVDALGDFLRTHSLDAGALGPAHHAEKSWAVSTARTSKRAPELPPTSAMDDEEAAIAAAIAASLADIGGEEYEESESSDGEDDDIEMEDAADGEESPRPASLQSIHIPRPPPAASASPEPDVSANGSNPCALPLPAPSESIPIGPPNRSQRLSTSVESLAGSYMERLESRFKSANDPGLLADRLLRQEQDAELAEALEADRRKRTAGEEAARRERDLERARVEAAGRLPAEPAAGSSGGVSVAVRLPGGMRVVRRFLGSDKLGSVADLCLSSEGGPDIARERPAVSLKSAGMRLDDAEWKTPLETVCAGAARVMFVVHEEKRA